MDACMLHKGSASETVLPAGAREGFDGGVSLWSLVSGCQVYIQWRNVSKVAAAKWGGLWGVGA